MKRIQSRESWRSPIGRSGRPSGAPVVLLHGFPYDVHAYDAVAERLAAAGRRCLIPYLRGYGPTSLPSMRRRRARASRRPWAPIAWRFSTPWRSPFGDPRGLRLGRPGGLRGRGPVARAGRRPRELRRRLQHPEHPGFRPARSPRRPSSGCGTSTTCTARAAAPAWPPTAMRSAACSGGCGRRPGASTPTRSRAAPPPSPTPISWRSWSIPTATASASCPATRPMRGSRRGSRPSRRSPCRRSCWRAADDGVAPPQAEDRAARHFTGPYRRAIVPGAGHNVPQEAPDAFADAVLALG